MVFTAFIIEHNGTTNYGPTRPDRSNLGLNPEACRSIWVNLGSRLEGVSKFYGVTVVASGATRAQAGEGFIWQELDKVKVKGKNEAVQIYTVRGTPDDLTPLLRDELAQWASFLQVWRAQQWVQAGALIRALAQQHPQQLLYALYQERVAARSAQPFDPGWDGSTQFETK